MLCLKCGSKLKTSDTFAQVKNNRTQRRLKCLNCGEVFYSEEKIIDSYMGRKYFSEKRKSYNNSKIVQ